MISLETEITLVAMLVALFIAVFLLQKSYARKRRITQDMLTLESAKNHRCDIRTPRNLTRLGLNPLSEQSLYDANVGRDCLLVIFFGIIILVAFAAWSAYLYNHKHLQDLGALTLAFALFCELILTAAYGKIEQSQEDSDKLQQNLEQYKRELAQPTPVKAKARGGNPVSSHRPERPAESSVNDVDELYQLASAYPCVPEDSALKRHFLSKLMAEISESLPPRPTDSTLKRHYETLRKSEFTQQLQALSEQTSKPPIQAETTIRQTVKPPVASRAKNSVRFAVNMPAMPEDSTLRRHFLTQLRAEIEDGFGPRPSDSALKRHYDAMVNAAFEEKVQALSSRTLRTKAKKVKDEIMAAAILAEPEFIDDMAHIPEDSTLRRHFLTQLTVKIVAKLPKSNDLNLLRRYQEMVQAELDKRMNGHFS